MSGRIEDANGIYLYSGKHLCPGVDEQVKCIDAYVEQNGITVLGRYGDYGKRHHAHKRQSSRPCLTPSRSRSPTSSWFNALTASARLTRTSWATFSQS